MAQVCISEDCDDEAGPFVRTPDGWICERCAEKEAER